MPKNVNAVRRVQDFPPVRTPSRLSGYASPRLCSASPWQARPAAQAEDKKPQPDVVIFTNGDQLTGTVERGMGDSIVFKSDMAGEITIPFAKIKELRSHGEFALIRKDTKTPTTNVQEGHNRLLGQQGHSGQPSHHRNRGPERSRFHHRQEHL